MSVDDFGKKIGGAKKDLWKLRGLSLDDLVGFNNLERDKYIDKNNVWKKPNYDELVRNGMSKRMAYYIKCVRDATPLKPQLSALNINYGLNDNEMAKVQENYITFVSNLRDDVLSLKTEDEILKYNDVFFNKYCELQNGSYRWSVKEENKAGLTFKLLRTIQVSDFYRFDRLIKEKKFGYTEDEKILSEFDYYFCTDETLEIYENKYRNEKYVVLNNKSSKMYFYPKDEELYDKSSWLPNTYFLCARNQRNILTRNIPTLEEAHNYARQNSKLIKSISTTKNRKKNFIPKQLKTLKRNGIDYRHDKQIVGEDLLNDFSFFGGEFGNYMNEKDRLQSLNYSYDAFKDLARALEIDEKDISLGESLSIAYGARGSGNAMAHYEPMRKVINLTKLRGAGSLAHEWGHALDDFLGFSLTGNDFMSENNKINLSPAMKNLVQVMRFDDAGKQTKYFEDSKKFDGIFSKSDKGYWSSKVEMFARAFSCYVADKINLRSDYLCGHTDYYCADLSDVDGDVELVKAYPDGKERKKINSCFDVLLKEMKEKNLLHEFDYSKEKESQKQYNGKNIDIPPLDSIQDSMQRAINKANANKSTHQRNKDKNISR